MYVLVLSKDDVIMTKDDGTVISFSRSESREDLLVKARINNTQGFFDGVFKVIMEK